MAKRRFRIESGRDGGEIVIGTVDKEFVEYFIDKSENELIEHLFSYDWDGPKDLDAPKPSEDFTTWCECNDKEHLTNALADQEFYVTEVPADGSADYADFENKREFSAYMLYERDAYHGYEAEHDVSDNKDYVPVLAFHIRQQGDFACWIVETDGEDFDENKFVYSRLSTNLAAIVEEAWYDKKLLEADFDYAVYEYTGYYARVGYMNTKYHNSKFSEKEIKSFWEDYDYCMENEKS